MGTSPQLRPIVQLLAALQAEGVRFILAGMSAANLQGVLVSTLDVDLWIGLPAREYMRVINLCRRLGATVRSANKVYLSDDLPVDFIYEVTGLRTFEQEFTKARRLSFHGLKIPVLSMAQICRSKRAAGRDKDKLHLLLIAQLQADQRANRRAQKRRKPRQQSKTKHWSAKHQGS